MMKKFIFLLFLISPLSVSVAESLDDWSNEDLCRWIDAKSIPDPVLLEIEERELSCSSNLEIIEIIESSTNEPYMTEHGTVFPSLESQNRSKKNTVGGSRIIFNYKIKL